MNINCLGVCRFKDFLTYMDPRVGTISESSRGLIPPVNQNACLYDIVDMHQVDRLQNETDCLSWKRVHLLVNSPAMVKFKAGYSMCQPFSAD